MNKEILSDAITNISSEYIEKAADYTVARKAHKTVWVKWGAIAACLCLVISGAIIWTTTSDPSGNITEQAGGAVQGGDIGVFPDGVDPITASVAVYPATAKTEDVASAEVVSLTESEALGNALSEHLPAQLPEFFHYGRGSVYNTVMKDGTQYCMLRIEYISGTISEQQFTEDGGAIAPDLDAMGEHFTACVMNYEPKANISICSSKDDVTLSLLEENGAAYIRSGDCYVGVFVETTKPEIVLDALRSISAGE